VRDTLVGPLLILDRRTEPHVPQQIVLPILVAFREASVGPPILVQVALEGGRGQHLLHPFRPLGEHLERVVWRRGHHPEHLGNEFVWHAGVK
jgi:hypothetical protein